MDIKELAKKLCDESGCHHKCKEIDECVVMEEAEELLINQDKSNNFDVKSNNELFKQALVEGVSRHFDKAIEEAKKNEQIEEMAEIIHKADVNNDTNTICFPLSMAECLNKHGAKRTNASIALYNAGYRKQSENTVEVVRCKDCINAKPYERAGGETGYYCQNNNNTFRYGTNWERLYEPIREANDYCSYGVKGGE